MYSPAVTPVRAANQPTAPCARNRVSSVQYLLFACDPYETIGFKVPNLKIDKQEGRFFTNWDKESKKFTVRRMQAQLLLKSEQWEHPFPVAYSSNPVLFRYLNHLCALSVCAGSICGVSRRFKEGTPRLLISC